MLAADPDLAAPAAGRLTTAGSGPPVPAESATPQQLPATVAHFTGRRAELQALTGVADQGGPGGRTAVISGTAGVGKTALAVHFRGACHDPAGGPGGGAG